jgi:hypothetical protein
MVAESLEDFRIYSLSYSEAMLVSPCEVSLCLYDLFELIWSYVAQWALFRCVLSFVNIAAYKASEFLSHGVLCFKC